MQIKYEFNQTNFLEITGYPIAYWVKKSTINAFLFPKLSTYIDFKRGIETGDNERFIRFWFELEIYKIKFDCKNYTEMGNYKWFPINSGGNFRRWYGNLEKVVDLWNNGYDISHTSTNYSLKNKNDYFRDGITYGRITSSKIAFRVAANGTLFGDAGPVGFITDFKFYILAFLSTNITNYFLSFINPTISFQVGDVMKLPLKIDEKSQPIVNELVQANIDICKADWDSFETSWDFKKHPLI